MRKLRKSTKYTFPKQDLEVGSRDPKSYFKLLIINLLQPHTTNLEVALPTSNQCSKLQVWDRTSRSFKVTIQVGRKIKILMYDAKKRDYVQSSMPYFDGATTVLAECIGVIRQARVAFVQNKIKTAKMKGSTDGATESTE